MAGEEAKPHGGHSMIIDDTVDTGQISSGVAIETPITREGVIVEREEGHMLLRTNREGYLIRPREE